MSATRSGGQRPVIIGVTGNIACGKSAVTAVLRDLGAATIDADLVYRDLTAPDQPLVARLAERFGRRVVDAEGGLDRAALGAIVFADPVALSDLDRLTHPAVIEEVERRIAAASAPVVAVDAVKLIESGMDRVCDQVWLVTCDPDVQRARLMAHNRITAEEADRRLRAQPPVAPKLARADCVIDNSGDLAQLAAWVRSAWALAGLPVPES